MSRPPDNGLTSRDANNLHGRYLEITHALEAGIFRASEDEGARLVGRKNDCAGLAIPYTLPWQSANAREYRLRLDNPILEPRTDGKPGYKIKQKYLSPPAARNRIYFPPGLTEQQLQDKTIPIVIQEGEFKTLAAWRIARERSTDGKPLFLPLGTSGAWNYLGTIGKADNPDGGSSPVHGFIPDLDLPAWVDRQVILLRDSNVHTNGGIQAASGRLAYELRCRGARVRFADTPELDGVNGADDLAARQGPDAVLALIFPEVSEDEQPDYEPISDDPMRETYLWRLVGNAAKLIRAVRLILQKLGMNDEEHARLIKNLIEANGYNRGPLRITHAILAEKYGMSSNTVARDIKRFKLEQEAKGIDLLGYTEGTYNPVTNQGYPSIFRLPFLRYALKAIDMALNMSRSEYEYSWEALEAAADKVVAEIPRLPVAVAEPPLRAECRKPTTARSLKMLERMALLQNEAINQMIAEGWGDSDIAEAFAVLDESRALCLEQIRASSLENGDYLSENGEEKIVSSAEDPPGLHDHHLDDHVRGEQEPERGLEQGQPPAAEDLHGHQDDDHVQSRQPETVLPENVPTGQESGDGLKQSGWPVAGRAHGHQDDDHVQSRQKLGNGSNGNSLRVLENRLAQDPLDSQPGFVWIKQKGGKE